MPFYSRHSNDGSDRFFGGINDEDDYNNFMLNIYMQSRFQSDIERHYENSDADIIPSSSEENKDEKAKTCQKEYHSKYFREKLNKPYTCNICGKTLSNSSNIKRHEKSKHCMKAKNNA